MPTGISQLGVNPPPFPEAVSFESSREGRVPVSGVARRFQPRRRRMAIRLSEPAMLEPVHPREGGELDGLEAAARAALADQLGPYSPMIVSASASS